MERPQDGTPASDTGRGKNEDKQIGASHTNCPSGSSTAKPPKGRPELSGWTSMAERLRASSGGGSVATFLPGLPPSCPRKNSRETPGGSGGGKRGTSGSKKGGVSMKGVDGGLANGHGHRMGQDVADAAAAMTKLAEIATMRPPIPSSTSPSSALDRLCPPEALAPPPPPPKKRKGWDGKPLEGGAGGKGVSGAPASVTVDAAIPSPSSGEKASLGSSVGVERRDSGGMHGVWDRDKENGGAAEGEGGGSKGRGDAGEGSGNHKRKAVVGGRNAPKKKGKAESCERTPGGVSSSSSEALPSVEAAVPEAGGDLSNPPAVSPFPNWDEDSEEMVGSKVRVYWDGDNEWYSGRIVRFKRSRSKAYLVRYDEDGSVEWMDLPKEPAIVARQVVWVKMRSHPWWPAQVYQPTGSAAMKDGMIEVKDRHAFVVFFKTDESGFVPVGQNVIQAFHSRPDLLNPTKKPSKGLEKAIAAARTELKCMAEAAERSAQESYAREDPELPVPHPPPPADRKPKAKKDIAPKAKKAGDGGSRVRKEEGSSGGADARAYRGDKPGKARKACDTKGKGPGAPLPPKKAGSAKAIAAPSADLSGLKDAIKLARMDAAADLLAGEISRDGARVAGKCTAGITGKGTDGNARKGGAGVAGKGAVGGAGKGTTTHAGKGAAAPAGKGTSELAGKGAAARPVKGLSAIRKQGNPVCNGTDVAALPGKGTPFHGQSAAAFPGQSAAAFPGKAPPGLVGKGAILPGKSAGGLFGQGTASISSRKSPLPIQLEGAHLTSGSEVGPIHNKNTSPFVGKPFATVPRAYRAPGSAERAAPPRENGRFPQFLSKPSGLELANKVRNPACKESGVPRLQEAFGMDSQRGSNPKATNDGAPEVSMSRSVPKRTPKVPRASKVPKAKKDRAPQRPVEVKNALQLAERAAAAARGISPHRQQVVAASGGRGGEGLSVNALKVAARAREAVAAVAMHRAGNGLGSSSEQRPGSDSRPSLLERDPERQAARPLFSSGPLGGGNVRESGGEGGVDRLPPHESGLGSETIVDGEPLVDDAGGPTPSVASSGRTYRSGSFASDDAGSRSLYGDSEDGGSVAGSSVAGSYAGDIDGDFGGNGSGGGGGNSGARLCRDGSRTRGGRRRGRGSGRSGRGGGGRGSRSGSAGRKGRKPAEGGVKGKPRAHEGFGLVGKTIKLHRDDVDYPNGRWCVADVQQWSRSQKKYLLSYRGRGSAWLPPGWLELKEKRKAQVVTVAPAESSSALFPFAGHIPGVGSRSSTRCSPLDFLEMATVVTPTPKSQAATAAAPAAAMNETSETTVSCKAEGKAAGKATGQAEEAVGSERDEAAAHAAEGLAVLAAVANAAPGFTSKASTLVEPGQTVASGKESHSGIDGLDRSLPRTEGGSATASAGDTGGGTVDSNEKGGKGGKPGGEVSAAGAKGEQRTLEGLAAEGGTAHVKDFPRGEPSSVIEGRSSEASMARAGEGSISGDNALQDAKNSTAAGTAARPGEASFGGRGHDDSSPGSAVEARVEKMAKTEKQGGANGAPAKGKAKPEVPDGLAETMTKVTDIEMTDAAPADKNVVKPKEETSSAADKTKALAKSTTRAGSSGVVAPRGLVRRDGDSGAACKMCRSKWDRDQTLVCCECLMHYHPGCLDPAMTPKELAIYGQGQQAWCCDYCQKCVGCGKGNEGALKEEGTPLICTERGKVHHAHIDAPEGSEPGPRANEKMWLCIPCEEKYKRRNYCPKCGVTFVDDDNTVKAVGCSACEFWVHAACEGLSTEEYQMLVDGTDNKEYLCPVCRDKAMVHMLGELQRADVVGMFAQPVTTAIAANYFLIVKEPMDLKTMGEKVKNGEYRSLQEMRDDCELMSKNALLFNRAPGEYHNRARNFFKITQIAWDSLQARPVNVASPSAPTEATSTAGTLSASGTGTTPSSALTPSSASAAVVTAASAAVSTTAVPPVVAVEVVPIKGKSAKRRVTTATNTAANATVDASAATATAGIGVNGIAAVGASANGSVSGGDVTVSSAAAATSKSSHPYQTKPGRHAEAVIEQQLLSRPKTVRAAGSGVRKDLLTGSTQPIKLRPLAENPDPSAAIGLGKKPTSSWISRPHAFMTDWIDLCLYCGCAGWDEQESVPRMNHAVVGSGESSSAVVGYAPGDGGGNASGNGSGVARLVEPGAGMSSVADARGGGVGDGGEAKLQIEPEQQQQQQLRPRLFCADCGECFHSWCTTAPVRTMDDKAASAWRCPNCKVCEVCTESKTSDDELLVFCELCDRAYHTYCLTPAPSRPPEGDWVCGQCISCKTCGVPQVYNSWSCTKEQCQSCILSERREEAAIEAKARRAVLSAELRTRKAAFREAQVRLGFARARALPRKGDGGNGNGKNGKSGNNRNGNGRNGTNNSRNGTNNSRNGGGNSGGGYDEDGVFYSEQKLSSMEAAETTAVQRATSLLSKVLQGARRWGQGSVASEFDGKCPVCKKKCDPNDDRMVECDACKLSVHEKCDKAVSPVLDNPELEYFCRTCLAQDDLEKRGARLDVPLPPASAARESASAVASAKKTLAAAEKSAAAAVEERRSLKARAAASAKRDVDMAEAAAAAATEAVRRAESREKEAFEESARASKNVREARGKVLQLEEAERKAAAAAEGGEFDGRGRPRGEGDLETRVSNGGEGWNMVETHLGASRAAERLCRRVGDIQARRKVVIDVRDRERWRRKQDERQWTSWEELRPQCQDVIDMALDRIAQLRAPEKQGISNMVASTAAEQSKVPHWLRTRAARFVRMQRYRFGERLRTRRREELAMGVQLHIFCLVSRAVSAAAFLAVSGVELTLPWPDEFTKQMAVQPPCFLHPTDANTTHSSGDVNASGSGGDRSPSSFYSRPNGALLLHPQKRHDDVEVGAGALERSPERPSERMCSPPPLSTPFVSSPSRAVAGVPGSQLDAEYKAQLELCRRRQQCLANGPSIPGDCRPLSPIQDDASHTPSPVSSPPSVADEMEVESSSCSASVVGRATGVVPGRLSFSAAVASSPAPSNSASASSSPVQSMSEAKKHEAEASAAVGAAQARVKREKRAVEKAKAEVRVTSMQLAAARERVAEAEKEAEAAVNPVAVDVAGGSKLSSMAKKKRRKKNGRGQDFAAVTTVATAGGGNASGNGSVSGSDASSESGMGGRNGTSGNAGAGSRGEGGEGLVPSPGVGCAGSGEELEVSGSGRVATVVSGGVGVSAAGGASGGIDAGMSDAVCAQLKTRPMKGWGVDVEAELGPWEDVRPCCLCKHLGDGAESGRLLPLDDGTWVHTHCGLWSSEVYEKPLEALGQIRELYKARGRGRLLECTLCREVGATVDCRVGKCDEVFHFQCAVDAGCVFFLNKTLTCPLHRPDGLKDPDGNTSSPFASSAAEDAASESASPGRSVSPLPAPAGLPPAPSTTPPPPPDAQSTASRASGVSMASMTSATKGVKPQQQQQETLSRGQLIQDPPKYMEAVRGPNKGKVPTWEDGYTYRIGALTIHRLGRLNPEIPGSHCWEHIFPVGFRSTRIFWSRLRPLQRTLYACEVLDGAKLTKHQLETADHILGGTRSWRRKRTKEATSSGGAGTVSGEGGVAAPGKRKRGSGGGRSSSKRKSRCSGNSNGSCSDGTEADGDKGSPEEEAFRATGSGRGRAKVEESKGSENRSEGVSGDAGAVPRDEEWWGDRWDEAGNYQGVVFRVTSMDEPQRVMIDSDLERLYKRIIKEVERCWTPLREDRPCFLRPRTSFSSFGLNGAQFFGLGFDAVREVVESWPDAVGAAVTPEDSDESQYRFVTALPEEEKVVAWQRRQAAKKAGVKANPSGCARAEILSESSSTARKGRITRTLVRAAEKLGTSTETADGGGNGVPGRSSSQQTQQAQYRQLKTLRTGHGLKVRRSHIHGWGLFACEEFRKDTMLVEYMGEVVRQCVADLREIKYEEMGVGSCYLFRADADAIVDATRKGNLARFINHCCDPNAIARIVNLDSSTKKIIIVAKRNIKPGEEITYDYKFEREDGQLPCHCGAGICYGSMN